MSADTNTDSDNERLPMIFISHRTAERDVANALAEVLTVISNKLDIHVATNSKFQGPRVGKSINAALSSALADTSLVLLIFSSATEDWSWCMWECGLATDPSDNAATKVVTLCLAEDQPKPFKDTLMVDVRDLESIQKFINQLCTSTEFFPELEEPLSDREPNDPLLVQHAELLHEKFSELTGSIETLVSEDPRWGGLTISLDLEEIDLDEGQRPRGEQVDELLSHAEIRSYNGWGLKHFGFSASEAGMTLFDLRKRWLDERRNRDREMLKGTSWSETVADEMWRVVTNRDTNLTWEPFLSVKQGTNDLWVHPLIYRFRRYSSLRWEFDLLIVQTLAPEERALSGKDSPLTLHDTRLVASAT